MRHRVKGTTTFGRKKAHRKAMIYNLVASLIRNNRIETTIVKAKEAARIAEKLVTFGKKDTVHARRQAFKILVNHELVKKLFNEIASQYKNRNGGYTRVIKTGFRRGDAAPIGILEFIEQEKVVSPKKKSETKTKSAKKFIKEKKTEKNETKPKSKYIKNKEEIDTDKLKKGKGKLPEQVEKDNEKQNINESAKKT